MYLSKLLYMNLYRNNLKCSGTHSHTWGDASKADLKRRLKSLEFATGLSSLQKITTQVLKNFRCTASTKKNSGIGDHLRMGNKRFHNVRSVFLFSWSHPNLSNIGRAWWHKAAMMTWTLTRSWIFSLHRANSGWTHFSLAFFRYNCFVSCWNISWRDAVQYRQYKGRAFTLCDSGGKGRLP